jgi:hypothetical protein
MDRAIKKRRGDDKENAVTIGDGGGDCSIRHKRTRASLNLDFKKENQASCICCGEYKTKKEELHCTTKDCTQNLLRWAAESENWDAHARLVIERTSEVRYHLRCLTKMQRNADTSKSQSHADFPF